MRIVSSNSEYGRQSKGSIFVLVLVILSSMTILSVGLAYRTRIEMRLAYGNAQRTQAYYLALGGIERIKALLTKQELSPLAVAIACQFTNTADQEQLFEQLEGFELTTGKLVSYSLRDELGYLNINNSEPEAWTNTQLVSKTFLSSVLDWIDQDEDMNPDGAETDYYERLEPQYVSKNKPCTALKELLYVKGVTPAIYAGEDLNHNRLLDDNERDGRSTPPFDNQDNTLDLGFIDIFTVYGNGKVNINTASAEILSALPGIDAGAAECILTYRAGADGILGTEDDACFTGAQDIAKAEGLTELQIELLGGYCCFDSRYFRVFSCSRLNNAVACSLMATLKYDANKPEVVYLERLL